MTERKNHWDKVYASTSPLEVSWYQQDPALSLKLIRDAGLESGDSVIDVGGGASTLVDSLLDAGHTALTVLDVSASALAHARQRLGEKASAVEWIEADVTAFDPPGRFELWHDRAVYHFLTGKKDRQCYVASMERALRSGGRAIIMTFAIGGPEKCSGLDIVQYDEPKLLGELGPNFELCATGHEVHVTPAGGEQKFAWFLLRYTAGQR
jgi:SAM-dependent methyltransferase